MAKKSPPLVLTLDQLKHGYGLAIENALRCFAAGPDLLREYPDKALAIAQLGQEELGKSLTLLAGASLPARPEAWRWFWLGWSDHNLKAHRAYLYEIMHPLRIEITNPDGTRYAGEPLRPRIAQEKEVGLYVDFDTSLGRFVSPMEAVRELDAFRRSTTLAYLGATASAVRQAMFNADEDFRMKEFGHLGRRICTEEIYQQDWPAILTEFEHRSERHQALVRDLRTTLGGVSDFFGGSAEPRESTGPLRQA